MIGGLTDAEEVKLAVQIERLERQLAMLERQRVLSERMMSQHDVPSRLIIESVVWQVAFDRSVSPERIMSDERTQSVAHARQDVWWELRNMRDRWNRMRFSYPVIAKHFNVDHTTVMYGVKRSADRRAYAVEVAA